MADTTVTTEATSTTSTNADPATAVTPAVNSPSASRPRPRRQVLLWFAIGWLVVLVLAALLGQWLPLPDPDEQNLSNRLAEPFSEGHILGTDGLGRDVLARTVIGAQISLTISVSALAIGMVVGGGLGMVVGYFRGWVEAVTMWAINVILAFPGLVLLLALVAFVGQSLFAITMVVGFLSIPIYARVARATTLAVSQREYILSAKALGAGHSRIMFREILPNVALPVAAFGLVALATLIVLETALAFLGLSVDAPSWGSLLADGRDHLRTVPSLAFIPGLMVFLTVLSVNFVGDMARSRFDVKESQL